MLINVLYAFSPILKGKTSGFELRALRTIDEMNWSELVTNEPCCTTGHPIILRTIAQRRARWLCHNLVTIQPGFDPPSANR